MLRRLAPRLLPGRGFRPRAPFSSEPPPVLVSVGDDRVATLTLRAPPVNTFSWAVADDFIAQWSALEADPAVDALVLASGVEGVFSAGLDLGELRDPERARLEAYWAKMQEIFMLVYPSRLHAVACIDGQCPALGCFLAADAFDGWKSHVHSR